MEQVDDQLWVELGVRGKRPDLPRQPYRRRAVASEHCGGELPELRRDATGGGGDRTEVQHAEPAARAQQEVARVQVGVHPAGARGGRVDGVPEQPRGQVGGVAAAEFAPTVWKQVHMPLEQCGQASPGEPAGDEHPWRRGVHGWNLDAGPALGLVHTRGAGYGDCRRDAVREGGSDLRLDASLAHIIQLLDDPAGELVRQSGYVQPGEPGDHPCEQPGLAQVRAQCLAHTRVLDFHRDVHDAAAVGPPSSAVHLADRGRRHGLVVECHEPLPPARPVGSSEVGIDYPAGGPGRHGRLRVGEPPQRRPVWRRDLLRHRRLEHRHRLPQLRCPALELTKGGEYLLGGAGSDLIRSGPGQPGSGCGGARRVPQRQHGQPAATPERASRQDRPLLAPRRPPWPLRARASVGHLDHPLSALRVAQVEGLRMVLTIY